MNIPESEKKQYVFSTGLDSNLGSLAEEIHSGVDTSEIEGPANNGYVPIGEDDPSNIPADFEDTPEEEPAQRLGKAVAESGGKALARAIDRIAAIVMSYIGHQDADHYRSSKSELEDIQDALVEYMKETGFHMSPGWNLAVALVSVYSFKFIGALRDREEYNKVLEARNNAK